MSSEMHRKLEETFPNDPGVPKTKCSGSDQRRRHLSCRVQLLMDGNTDRALLKCFWLLVVDNITDLQLKCGLEEGIRTVRNNILPSVGVFTLRRKIKGITIHQFQSLSKNDFEAHNPTFATFHSKFVLMH